VGDTFDGHLQTAKCRESDRLNEIQNCVLLLGVLAIPAWYAYRTLNEKRVCHLEWNEMFMTEDARQQKWAEEKKQAQERAEAERVREATELEKATAVRRTADAEAARLRSDAAKAEAAAAEKRIAEKSEVDRERIASERRVAEQAAVRARAEKERSDQQKTVASRLQTCATKTKEASLALYKLSEEQAAYRAYTDKVLQEPFPSPGRINEKEFANAFRYFYRSEVVDFRDPQKLNHARESCESLVEVTEENLRNFGYAVEVIEGLTDSYRSGVEMLKHSATEIGNLSDYAAFRIPDTLGGKVIADRIRRVVDEVRYK
jgi:hypothetical protein